jgi:hypothetical protein
MEQTLKEHGRLYTLHSTTVTPYKGLLDDAKLLLSSGAFYPFVAAEASASLWSHGGSFPSASGDGTGIMPEQHPVKFLFLVDSVAVF